MHENIGARERQRRTSGVSHVVTGREPSGVSASPEIRGSAKWASKLWKGVSVTNPWYHDRSPQPYGRPR